MRWQRCHLAAATGSLLRVLRAPTDTSLRVATACGSDSDPLQLRRGLLLRLSCEYTTSRPLQPGVARARPSCCGDQSASCATDPDCCSGLSCDPSRTPAARHLGAQNGSCSADSDCLHRRLLQGHELLLARRRESPAARRQRRRGLLLWQLRRHGSGSGHRHLRRVGEALSRSNRARPSCSHHVRYSACARSLSRLGRSS